MHESEFATEERVRVLYRSSSQGQWTDLQQNDGTNSRLSTYEREK
jgi:hypothetical protein